LEPGTFTLEADASAGSWEPDLLGKARAEVKARETTKVRLAVGPPDPGLTRCPLNGELALPAGWGLERFTLFFEDLDAALGVPDGYFPLASSEMRRSSGSDRWSWSLASALPGRYDVELTELSFHARLDAPAEGLAGAVIEVPPPCDVAVRCVDFRS